ncbi:MAG: DNA endonuclease SmrA [Halioglobus sp.]
MNGDGDKIFSAAVADVVPLKRETRADLGRKTATGVDLSLEYRRRAAAQLPQRDRNPLSATDITPLDAWYVLAFKRPGVQNGVYRKLKQGRYEILSRLDLHRMTVEIARREVFDFLEEACQLGLRSVLVVHGKGESKAEKERSSLLKGCVDKWLRELDVVLAFHSAQPQHGGTGAAYVLLRKSEEKKRENREKFSNGRVPFDSA